MSIPGIRWLALRLVPLKRSSLRTQLALVYSALALANLLFFSVVVFENQSDILLQLFKLQSERITRDLARAANQAQYPENAVDRFAALKREFAERRPRQLALVDSSGLAAEGLRLAPLAPGASARLAAQIARMRAQADVFAEPYSIHLNESDFSVDFVFPLTRRPDEFIAATIDVHSMKDRLGAMYVQIGVAAAWVVLFHIAFAIYVFRVILRRVDSLRETSALIESGDLSASVAWTRPDGDELNALGNSFNSMAVALREKVGTISRQKEAMEKELAIGRMVQQLIVNNSADIARFSPFIEYQPLRMVSGDVYKFYELKREGAMGVFFGDASGHGVSAALITSLVINHLDRIVREDVNPQVVISKLNEALAAKLDGSQYTTGCFLLFHYARKMAYFCNAGHLPPLFIRPGNRKYVEAEASGPPVGIMSGFPFRLQAVQVASGDLIVIYSDGLSEAMNRNSELYTAERMTALILANCERDPEEIGRIVLADVRSFCSEFHDDLSLIILRAP